MKNFLIIFATVMICLGIVKIIYSLILKFRKRKEK